MMWPRRGGLVGVTRLLVAALAAFCLAGCAAPDRPGPPPATAPATTAPDGIRDRTVPWDAGRLDADPRRVVVSWTGANPDADPSDPCWVGYAPEVSAEPDRVVVTIRTYRSRVPLGPQQSCTDLGFIRTLAVPLHNQLAGRTVVDGHSGRRRRLAPVPLEPRWLPPGWRLVDELGQNGAAGGSWQRGYGPASGAGAAPGGVGVSRVTVTDGPAAMGGAGSPDGRVVARPAVRGGAAAVVRSQGGQDMAVRWREGRRGLAVAATFPTAPSGRAVAAVQDLLVRIAKGLR
jgi:hypothetical protein